MKRTPQPTRPKICADHDDCDARAAQIKLTKGFTTKEPVKWHMVNVVKGLKLYEDVFNDLELEKLTDFVNEVLAAGHNGELSGDTFILFNKQMKGNKRELIQVGFPIFEHVQEESPDKNKTSKTKRNDRLYDLHLRLSVKPSPNKRVAITFFKVRPDCHQVSSPTGTSPTGAMMLWQPGSQSPNSILNGMLTGYEALDIIPPWGVLHAPVVMLAAPVGPMALIPKKIQQEGTGMFLPWAVSPRKPSKHLPPRAQKGRFLTLPSMGKPRVSDSMKVMESGRARSECVKGGRKLWP